MKALIHLFLLRTPVYNEVTQTERQALSSNLFELSDL